MATNDGQGPCPICEWREANVVRDFDTGNHFVACSVCGKHILTDEAYQDIAGMAHTVERRARIRFAVARMERRTAITTVDLRNIAERTERPGIQERLDRLVELLGAEEPGAAVDMSDYQMMVRLGCLDMPSTQWMIKVAEDVQLIESAGLECWTMTFSGWERFHELQRAGLGAANGFMAMAYGETDLDSMFEDHFKPAAHEAGFALRRADGPHQPAGSIDNSMRVDIRTSRFVVCDLTHANCGCYWEAGFAEGIGRPVIFTCRADVLESEEHKERPHFDTRNQLIIPWSLDDPAPARNRLKNAIRATLPDEARLSD